MNNNQSGKVQLGPGCTRSVRGMRVHNVGARHAVPTCCETRGCWSSPMESSARPRSTNRNRPRVRKADGRMLACGAAVRRNPGYRNSCNRGCWSSPTAPFLRPRSINRNRTRVRKADGRMLARGVAVRRNPGYRNPCNGSPERAMEKPRPAERLHSGQQPVAHQTNKGRSASRALSASFTGWLEPIWLGRAACRHSDTLEIDPLHGVRRRSFRSIIRVDILGSVS